MIKFSLQHIAERAPYELLLSENDFEESAALLAGDKLQES